jgi:hypothetical protein
MLQARSFVRRLVGVILAVAVGPTAFGTPAKAQNMTATLPSSSANPSVFGEVVEFSADVLDITADDIAFGGTVTFLDGSTMLGTVPVGSGGAAELFTSTLSVGMHTITAHYNGTANVHPSTDSVAHTVNPAPTTTTLSSSGSPSGIGQSATFTATVIPSGGSPPTAPTGSVTSVDQSNGARLDVVTLGPIGEASLSTNALTVGSHTIQASYDGDANFVPSASNQLSRRQPGADDDHTWASPPSPSAFGQSVTFTATTAVGNVPVTTGEVAFFIFPPAPPLRTTVQVDANGQASFTPRRLRQGRTRYASPLSPQDRCSSATLRCSMWSTSRHRRR